MRPLLPLLFSALTASLLSCSDSATGANPPATTKVDSAAGSTPGSLRLGDGGYFTGGSWKGYPWTAAIGTGTIVSPVDFKSVKATDTRLCAKGKVGKDPAYGGAALLGINLNQESLPPTSATEPPIFDYTPTGTGIKFQVSNPGGSDLRIQIQDKSGTASGRWCASISGKTSGTVLWADFNTSCWSPATGKAYNKEPLKDISVGVPGKDTQDVPYEFCIESLSELP